MITHLLFADDSLFFLEGKQGRLRLSRSIIAGPMVRKLI